MRSISYKVQLLFKRGIGYGVGAISHADGAVRLGGGEKVRALESHLQSPNILIDVAKDQDGNYIDDDGCGDGRRVAKVMEGEIVRNTSLDRPKVFGASVMMMASSLIGMGKAVGQRLNSVFQTAQHHLIEKKVGYGAHTDDHAHGDKSGCGAIDNAPAIISNIAGFRAQIAQTLLELEVNSAHTESILENFTQYSVEIQDQPYSGKKVVDDIVESGQVVKELTGPHQEMYILLNFVEGKTVDQKYIREMTDDKAQVFAVDVWRLKSITRRAFPDDEVAQEKAFVSELVYTLGTAATLTKGDLPVYAIQQAA